MENANSYVILVIDDDGDILTIVRDNLELDGYTVLTADTGKKGLSLFEKQHVDLVVLDLMLPDMDGLQICRAIRAVSTVSIIMLTARDGVSDKVLGLEHGADDYLVKPFDFLELAARIKARLRRSIAGTAFTGNVAVGGVTLHPTNLIVAVDGRDVKLTPKEFDLFRLLVSHPGQALERDVIRREIWPKSKLYRWSRTIDVHVQHLRAKLETHPDDPQLIRTVPGVGYMYCPVPAVPE